MRPPPSKDCSAHCFTALLSALLAQAPAAFTLASPVRSTPPALSNRIIGRSCAEHPSSPVQPHHIELRKFGRFASFSASILCCPPAGINSGFQTPAALLKFTFALLLRGVQGGAPHVPHQPQKRSRHYQVRAPTVRAVWRRAPCCRPCLCACLTQQAIRLTLLSPRSSASASLLAQSLQAWHLGHRSWCRLIQYLACAVKCLPLYHEAPG